MARGFDPAAFDIVREDLRDIDTRDFRDRPMERERERPEREEERDLPDLPVSMMEVINDDTIVVTPEIVELINDPEVRVTRNGEITRRTGRDVIRRSGQFGRSAILPDISNSQTGKKRKRKRSKYQAELGRQLKMLKKKHPRTKVVNLMKRAHRATKKALK